MLAGDESAIGTSSEPPELLVAVNGTHRRRRRRLPARRRRLGVHGFVGDVYRDGANDVELYEVATSGDVTLHPAS